jgi:hypothetical protein
MQSRVPKWIEELSNIRPFFDFSKAKPSATKYVAWIDILGSSSYMSISSKRSAIFIGKLHVCIIRAKRVLNFSGNVYPFVDGCYITCDDIFELQKFLKLIFYMLAISFILEKENINRFMCRASISYGDVVEASAIEECSGEFDSEYGQYYLDSILFGSSLARVNQAEKMAAPFGVWVDEMARMFPKNAAARLPQTAWRWWDYESGYDLIDRFGGDIELELAKQLKEYYQWCESHSWELLYGKEAIERHKFLAAQYFPSWNHA